MLPLAQKRLNLLELGVKTREFMNYDLVKDRITFIFQKKHFLAKVNLFLAD